MLQHYFTTAIRNLFRNRFYSSISLLGLSFGLASVFLIVQYLREELSYDRFHNGAENIYRISWENENPQTRTPHPMAQAMVSDFPEVESAVSLSPLWGPGLTRRTFSIQNPDKDVRYDESGVLAVDSTFFDVFSFQLIEGDPHEALRKPGGILISESIAKKYFGTTDAVGKHLQVNVENNLVEVYGVFRDVPQASHFHFDILVSYVREKLADPGNEYYTWRDFGHYNYIRLKPGTDAKALENKLMPWVRKYITIDDAEFKSYQQSNYGFRIIPITDIHLRSHIRWELESNGNINYVYLMAAAALLILVIGAVNFVNLSLAQATERAREIGIRKSMGAFRRQLTLQFLGESVMITSVAIILSVVLVELAIPFFRAYGSPITLDYGSFILTLVALGAGVAMLAGIYPSIYLSGIRPAVILKGNAISPGGGGLRKAFITFQFLASMGLISAEVIISQQLAFLKNKDLGFGAEEVLVVPIKDRSMNTKIEELRNELLQVGAVTGVSATSNIPGKSFNQNPIYAAENIEHSIDASEAQVDEDFFKIMGITFTEGRSFIRGNRADSNAFVLNEQAVSELGLKDPVGKEILWERDGTTLRGPVIGVMKDFHFQSLHEPLRPLLMRQADHYNFAVIKVSATGFNNSIAKIEEVWRKFDNRFRFEFSFLDDQLNRQYQTEQTVAGVLGAFSTIGLLIACMGLLGIAALTFRQRTKEVSIRKVLGASVPNLVALLLKDFTRLIVIAIVLAVPLVWWVMARWLENFTYRITINPVVFIITSISLLLITWGTLSFLTLKTTQLNPAETLKAE